MTAIPMMFIFIDSSITPNPPELIRKSDESAIFPLYGTICAKPEEYQEIFVKRISKMYF
jgi:hypothetical protein